tara:strand:- start:292 stop:813 length:522 start_codon:yes stop_codon:yes gene_type:complete
MSQAEPIKATFSRDEIEKRINESLEREGEINREFTDEPSVQDLMYDELRNLNGALASIDERICETNSLLHDIRSKQVNTNELRKVVSEDEHMTQEDIDDYMNSVKDHYVLNDEEPIMKRVKFSKNERHIIYKALGSRASTLRNQMGYNRINDDDNLKEEIVKHEKLIHKLKNS